MLYFLFFMFKKERVDTQVFIYSMCFFGVYAFGATSSAAGSGRNMFTVFNILGCHHTSLLAVNANTNRVGMEDLNCLLNVRRRLLVRIQMDEIPRRSNG